MRCLRCGTTYNGLIILTAVWAKTWYSTVLGRVSIKGPRLTVFKLEREGKLKEAKSSFDLTPLGEAVLRCDHLYPRPGTQKKKEVLGRVSRGDSRDIGGK